MKKLITLGAGVICLTATSLVATPPANAATCILTQYVGKTTTSSIVHSTALTHATQYGVPPNGTLSTSKTAEKKRVLTGSFKVSTGAQASTGLVPKIIGSVKVSTHVEIAGQAEATRSYAETISYGYKNNTTKNQIIVAYVGTTQYKGKWSTTSCKGNGGQSTLGTVVTTTGTFDSWEGRGEGWLLCSASGGSALMNLARKYCA